MNEKLKKQNKIKQTISISVQPNQSTYFAGERFQCNLEFKSNYQSSNIQHTNSNLIQFPQPNRKLSVPSPTSLLSLPLIDSSPTRRNSSNSLDSTTPFYHSSLPITPINHSFSNHPSCLLTWLYCQLEGYFEVQERYVNLDYFQSLRQPQTHGGGRLSLEQQDINQDQDVVHLYHHSPIDKWEKKKPTSTNRTSWMGSLFGSTYSSRDRQNLHSPSSPMSSSFLSSIPSNRFPVFQNPVSLLDVDLSLQPGQSRSYSFSIDLPINLPPTHKSKCIKFSYELIIGTNVVFEQNHPTGFDKPYQSRRTSAQSFSSSAGPFDTKFPTSTAYPHHKTRTFRVPIKVFNHVDLNQTQKPCYDLFKPIISTKDTAKINKSLTTSHTLSINKNGSNIQDPLVTINRTSPPTDQFHKSPEGDGIEKHDDETLDGLVALEKYALELMGGVDDRHNLARKAEQGERVIHEGHVDDELDDGCLTAIEIATRSSPRVSFDIMKDGFLVAQLTLVKSIYRLGETIEGVVEINGNDPFREAGRVIKYGISLESAETFISPQSVNDDQIKNRQRNSFSSSISIITNTKNAIQNQQHTTTRKIFSEQEELVVDVGRAKFALAIPIEATPEFETSVVKLEWNLKLRLQFIPRLTGVANNSNPNLSSSFMPQAQPLANQYTTTNSISKQDKLVSNRLLPEEDELNKSCRPGLDSADFGSLANNKELGVKKLKHFRSKSNGFFNQPHQGNSRNNNHNSNPRFCHLVNHSVDQGIYKPVPDLGMIPMTIKPVDKTKVRMSSNFDRSSSISIHNYLNNFGNRDDGRQKNEFMTVTPVFLECFVPVKVLPAITHFIPAHHSFIVS